MTGQGFLEKLKNQSFKGQFKDGKLHGEGEFFVKDGTYKLVSKWEDGVPAHEANKVLFEVLSPVEEEEDPKAKKDAKKAPAAPVDEGEGTGNEIKIAVDLANPNEEQRKLTFEMKIVFQGESYEDPNPPEEDDAAKKKKGKDPSEPEVRMITPEPVILEGEMGREFEFELGRNEQVKIEKTPNESQKNMEDEGAAAEGEEEEPQYETKWIQYKLD